MTEAIIIISGIILGILTTETTKLITNTPVTNNRVTVSLCLILNAAVPLMMRIPSEKLNFAARLLILIVCILGKFIFYSIIFKKIKAGIIYICLVTMITSQIYSTLFELISENSDYHLIASNITESVVISIILITLKKAGNAAMVSESFRVIPKRLYIDVIILLYTVSLFIWAAVNNQVILTKILMIPALIGLVAVIVAVMRTTVSEGKEQQVADILSEQVDNQVEYYNKVNDIYTEFRGFRHDLKNHLLCLRSLISAGESEKALEYINSIENLPGIQKKEFNTGNIIVDAMLSDKKDTAKKNNIDILFNGFIPTSGISNTDLCIIIANAADNAIEACKKGNTEDKKEIRINADFRQGYFFFDITNPVYEEIKYRKNKIITSKKDKLNHGFGLSNILKTVNKYNGQADIITENNEFKLDICLLLRRD